MRAVAVKLLITIAAFGSGPLGAFASGLLVTVVVGVVSAQTKAEASPYPEWLCAPDRIVAKDPIHVPSLPPPGEFEMKEIYLRHEVALRAAEALEAVPDLEGKSKGSELVEGLRRFSDAVPEGYEYFAHYADAQTGIKYAILSPISDQVRDVKVSRPWIIAFAGSQKAIEWISNPALIPDQIRQLARQTGFLLRCGYRDELGRPLSERDFIVTGHGVGGGIAQAFAVLVQKQRSNAGLKPLMIDLVTWNAFGASALVETIAGLPAGIETWIQGANYFVRHDPMAKIGVHIGAAYELVPSSVGPKKDTATAAELLKRHSLAFIRSLIKAKRIDGTSVLASAVKSIPSRLPAPLESLRTMFVTGKLPKGPPELSPAGEFAILGEAIQAQVVNGPLSPASVHALSLMEKMLRFRTQSFNDVRGGEPLHLELLAMLLDRVEQLVPPSLIQSD